MLDNFHLPLDPFSSILHLLPTRGFQLHRLYQWASLPSVFLLGFDNRRHRQERNVRGQDTNSPVSFSEPKLQLLLGGALGSPTCGPLSDFPNFCSHLYK